MDFYDSLELTNWKQCSDEEKENVFSSVLMYFVSPLVLASSRKLRTFEMCGMKCRTFEVELNGEPFVFIPGQKNTVLGWDFGTEGLKNQDIFEEDTIGKGNKKNTYKTHLTKEELRRISDNAKRVEELYNFDSLDDIGEYINTYTSSLRRADIPPMLVAKQAQPVGAKKQGEYDAVSGQFDGNHEFLAHYREEIRSLLCPQLSLEESLSWEHPSVVLKNNDYYLQQQVRDADRYTVYSHTNLTYEALRLELDMTGFDLLNEDEWEFAVGGGTRRLFRWGNEILLDSKHPLHSVFDKAMQPNMFGLTYSVSRSCYELTDTIETVKLGIAGADGKNVIQQVLPMSSYYQSWHKISEEEGLNPTLYTYRKVVKIQK